MEEREGGGDVSSTERVVELLHGGHV